MDKRRSELQPPNAGQVVRRAMVLSAIVCRASIEHGAGDAEAEGLKKRIEGWLDDLDLAGATEPRETAIIAADLGTLRASDANQATWAVDGLAMLAWSLGCFEIPPHDRQVDPYVVTDAINFLSPNAKTQIDSSKIRARETLTACRELMYAVHCRLHGRMRNDDPVRFSNWIEYEWLTSLAIDRSQLIFDDDLRIGAGSIGEASVDAVNRCEWAICQRHRASIWLLGEEGPSYWDWPVDT